jgi:RHS repeat-associated protein
MMFDYTYGRTGNRLTASDRNGGSSYSYDSIYRMTEEAISRSEAKGTLTYGLDPVGNRQSLASTVTGISQQSASYNANDQVTANTYDSNGNTLGASGKSYAYDSMDRMTSFNNGSVKMVYDGDGNRVAKTVGGVTTQYLVDELNPTGLPQVMDEVVKSGVAQRTYLYGLRRISQTQVASGTTSYYGYDAHGDVRYLMNSGGVVSDTYDYDAFGNLVGSTGTTPNVYRYQGEALDAETGLYYMRARYYDPTVGRFLNVDPMTDQGEHPYEYAAADPVNGHDPTGEQDVIEDSLSLEVTLPSTAAIIGSGAAIRCLANLVLSEVASAGAEFEKVGWCRVEAVYAAGGGGRGGGGSGNAPPGKPGKNPCSASCQSWIKAHGKDAAKAAGNLSLKGTTGEADILALSAVESAWGTFKYKDPSTGQMKTGFPGAWFSMHGAQPGMSVCAPIPGGSGCVAEFPSFDAAAQAFVQSWQGQLVNNTTDPKDFFTKLQVTGKFGVNKNGSPVPWFLTITLSVETDIDNCLKATAQ